MSLIFVHYFLFISKLNYQNIFHLMPQRKSHIPKIQQTDSDKIIYAYIDKLEEQLQRGGWIHTCTPKGWVGGCVERKNSMSIRAFKLQEDIQIWNPFWVPMVVYTYDTPGIATNWVVIFKVTRGIHTDNPDVIRWMSDAANYDPIFMSHL